MRRQNEWVTVATPRGLVEVPWDSRQELLERLRRNVAASGIVCAFEDVGTSRPVTLARADRELLRATLMAWAAEPGVLPARLPDLQNALRAESAG